MRNPCGKNETVEKAAVANYYIMHSGDLDSDRPSPSGSPMLTWDAMTKSGGTALFAQEALLTAVWQHYAFPALAGVT